MIYIGLASLLAYPLLVGAWLLADTASARKKRLLGVAAILAAAPFFVWLGLFVSLFGDNMCYSNLVATLVELPATYERSQKEGAVERFTREAKTLPLEGYETRCRSLSAAVKAMATKAELGGSK